MTTVSDLTTGVQHRAAPLQIRETEAGAGMTVTGLAVPYNLETELYRGYFEAIAPGAVVADDGKLFLRHRDPIGTTTGRETEAGYQYTGTISDTALGRDAATLCRDGVLDKASIGFEPLEWTETHDEAGYHIRHTRIRIREISLVPHPAYETTTATARHANPAPAPSTRQEPAMDTTADNAGLDALAVEVETLRRTIATLEVRERPTPTDTRSAGALLRAATAGDDTAVATLNRAYAGGTSADDFGNPTWVADLTQLTEQADDLAGIFADAPLPETGMTLEYGQLKDNTLEVSKQAAEGDAIPTGNLSVTTKTVPVDTYAGGTSLTVQEIKRSQAPLLDMHMRGLALEAGKASAAAKLAALNAIITTNAANPLASVALAAGGDWKPWVRAILGARKILKRYGLGLSGLLLPEEDWATMAEWEDADGRPILTPQGTTRDVGSFEVRQLNGDLLTIPTRLVDGLDGPAFANAAALRHYKAPLVRLQNSEIFTLSEDFAVYQFGAVAAEIPGAIVPVTSTP